MNVKSASLSFAQSFLSCKGSAAKRQLAQTRWCTRSIRARAATSYFLIIILRLQSRQLQDFCMHIDLWQVCLSHLLIYQLHDILTTIGCMWCKMCVDVPASFCHGVVHKKRIFMEALPLEGEGCVQGTLAGAFWHKAQEVQCWSWNE